MSMKKVMLLSITRSDAPASERIGCRSAAGTQSVHLA